MHIAHFEVELRKMLSLKNTAENILLRSISCATLHITNSYNLLISICWICIFKPACHTLILSTMEPFLSIAPYTARGTRQHTTAISTTATITGITGIMKSPPR